MNLRINALTGIILFISISWTSCQKIDSEVEKVEEAKVEYLTKLSSKLRENSGIIKLKDQFWLLNDGGNGAFLLSLDISSGKVVEKLKVEGVKNRDWEELSMDAEHIIIGDIGNNNQSRKNLRFHLIEKDSLGTSDTLRVSSTLKFKYDDQKSYPPKKGRNFDCEAFLSFGDSLYLFTKNYGNDKCNVYSLDKISKNQKAKKIGSFKSIARVTGAAKHPSEEYFILLAYQSKYSSPYIWIVWKDAPLSQIKKLPKKYLKLPIRAQAEAITHLEDHKFIITAEKGGSLAARAFILDVTDHIQKIKKTKEGQ